MRDREVEKVTGQKAVEQISNAWREYRAGEPPIEEINIILGEEGSSPAKWENGTVTVAEEMNKGRYGTSSLECQIFDQIDEAIEKTIEKEVQKQKQELEERYSFLEDFGIKYNGTQIAEIDNAGAHHGRQISKPRQISDGVDYIVVDYSYLPWIDPIDENIEGPAEEVIRHETVHALQNHVDNGFKEIWQNTGMKDIERSTTEGMARYEQFKDTKGEREAEQAIQNPEKIPEYWREEILDENLEESDPYSYGELAAYFLEEAYREARMDELAEQNPNRAIHLPSLNEQVESKVRATMLQNPGKEGLDSELSNAAKHLDFPFYGDLVKEEYEKMESYLEGKAQFTEELASPEGKPGLVKVLEGEDAAERALESASFTINELDYDIEDYHRAEARLLAAEKLDFRSESYSELRNALESTYEENREYSNPIEA